MWGNLPFVDRQKTGATLGRDLGSGFPDLLLYAFTSLYTYFFMDLLLYIFMA